jgi:hypothetical protein
MRRDSGQRVREILDETHRQIAPTLTDEQRQKLQRMKERHRRRHRGRRSQDLTPEPSLPP